MGYKKVILGLFLFVFVGSYHLYGQAIAPDRPGLGNGTHVIDPDLSYLETGAEYYSSNAYEQYSFGQVLLRSGFVKGAELRIMLNSYLVQEFSTTTQTGFPDPGAGIKVNLFDDGILNISVLGELSVPIGSDRYSNDEWLPSASFLADYNLNNRSSVTVNMGRTFEAKYFPGAWKFVFTPGFSLPNSNVGYYFGYAGTYFDSEAQHVNRHFIEGGITALLNSYVQIDINTGFNIETEGFFIGGGLAVIL